MTTGRLSTDHIAALESLHTPVTVDRRCADLSELIAAAELHRADAALIVGDTAGLTASRISSLAEHGVRVVVISDAAAERSRLRRLGAQCFADDVDAEPLADALLGQRSHAADEESTSVRSEEHLEELPSLSAPGAEFSSDAESGWIPDGSAASQEGRGPEDEGWSEDGTRPHNRMGLQGGFGLQHSGDVQVDAELGSGAQKSRQNETAQPPGHTLQGITVVWGPAGAPGRTTVAVNLAAELALATGSALLIDADAHAAAAAVQLGLLEESAGIAQACRAAELGSLDEDTFEQALVKAQMHTTSGSTVLPVLTGLPRADRWPELRPRALERVMALARSRYRHVVVDIGADIDEDEELSFDTGAPQRSSAAVIALTEADHVIMLGTADAVGFSRLIKAREEYRYRFPQGTAPQVVINQLRKSAVGRSPRRQLSEAWEQLSQQAPLQHFLPYDRMSCDEALRCGQVLAEAAPDSALRRQLADLASISLAGKRRLKLRRGRARAR